METSTSQNTLSQGELTFLRDLSKQSFFFFAKFVLDFPFPSSWLTPHVHKPLCDALQEYTLNRRVCVTLPRSWLKSTVCSIYYPIWRAIRDPNIRVLIVQNSASNAQKKLTAIRGQFESNPLLRALFPEILPTTQSTWSSQSACLNRTLGHPESTFESAGTRTRLISRHYDLIIEDDTVAPDLDELTDQNVIPTKDDIDQAIGFHKLATGLLVDFKTSQIIIVGTRWFERDLISWNAEHEKSYLQISRAVRETDGKADVNGEVTYPERFDADTLEELRAVWGEYLFSCLYMNLPLRSEDMIFKPEWIRYYDQAPRKVVCYTLVDPAGGSGRKAASKSDPDFNVVMTVGKDLDAGHLYVLEYTRFRGSPGQLIHEIFRHQALWKSLTVGIEGVQYQNSLDYFVTEQQRKRNQYFHVEMLKSIGAKEVRIRALQPLFSTGSILIRTHMTELHAELMAFPLAAHDDCVDALSMVLQLLDITSIKGVSEDIDPSLLDKNTLEYSIFLMQERSRPDPNNLITEMTDDPQRSFSSDYGSPWISPLHNGGNTYSNGGYSCQPDIAEA